MTDESRPGSQRRPDWAALAIAVLLGVAAIVIGWSTATMPGAANYARIGPTSFPYAIAAVLFVLAMWTAVAALRGEFPKREEQNIGADGLDRRRACRADAAAEDRWAFRSPPACCLPRRRGASAAGRCG